jgi:hypothetical protein
MRLLPGILLLLFAAPAIAQPAPASMEPAPPPSPSPAPAPAPYYQPAAPYYQPPPTGPRRGWFGVVGLGAMGYVGREGPRFVTNDPDAGSGVSLEAVVGKWIRDELAVGARLEAHTDDAETYTNSSLTAVTRFPIGAQGRFYLEPGLGLAFNKNETTQSTDTGIALAITGGYALTRRRFAFDLRFGLSHHRIDHPDPDDSYNHGTVWLGGALGFQ